MQAYLRTVGVRVPGKQSKNVWRRPMQAYCLKCRDHREIENAEQVTLKNGRPATRGTCSVCKSTVFRIGKAA